jgi:hypothetical protein
MIYCSVCCKKFAPKTSKASTCSRACSSLLGSAVRADKMSASFASRFWGRVVKTTGCWLWSGSKNKQGYGTVKRRGRLLLAHRIAFELSRDREPVGLVLHSCDNASCVRPDHLREGSHQDNSDDMVLRGRINDRRGELGTKHKLRPDDVRRIRSSLADGVAIALLAKQYHVCESTISHIRTGRTWSVVT